jgi:plastocyanin
MTRTVQCLTAASAAALLALVPVTAGAGATAAKKKPVTKTVEIYDNYYGPAKVTLPVGSTVTWRWPVDTGDSHDDTLDKGPKGVKKFQSEVAAAEYSYKRKLLKPGRYHIICTLHDEMTMDITVR